MAKRHRPTQQTPDLFAAATPQGLRHEPLPATNEPAPERRCILPRDLPAALTRLTNEELEALAKVVTGELHRRNLRADAEPVSRERPRPILFSKAEGKKPSQKRTTKSEVPSLTQSQINAIRAAFKVGVKPTMIVRQFGVSHAAIRQALSGKRD
jgi:hypothetical protein